MQTKTIADRVELDDDRYITDQGVPCDAIDETPYVGRKCHGVMWVYVVQFPGHMAQGMCCKCHHVVFLDLGGPHPSGTITIADLKAAHAKKAGV